MRQTSGIIINNDIFINSSHVVKMDKGRLEKENDASDTIVYYHTINIYTTVEENPTVLFFDSENERDVIFNKIVMELYGYNYALVNF
jgi:hypothetical protein